MVETFNTTFDIIRPIFSSFRLLSLTLLFFTTFAAPIALLTVASITHMKELKNAGDRELICATFSTTTHSAFVALQNDQIEHFFIEYTNQRKKLSVALMSLLFGANYLYLERIDTQLLKWGAALLFGLPYVAWQVYDLCTIKSQVDGYNDKFAAKLISKYETTYLPATNNA